MRRSTLLTQVLAVNGVLVGITALIAAVVARDRLPGLDERRRAARARPHRLERDPAQLAAPARAAGADGPAVQAMTRVDLARPGHARAHAAPRRARGAGARRTPSTACSTGSRTSAATPAAPSCGRRSRSARASPRTSTTRSTRRSRRSCCACRPRSATRRRGLRAELQETQQLVTQAMDELLALARQLRPTALDDHGLVAALASQVTDFGRAPACGRASPPRHDADAVRRGAARDLPRDAGEPVEHRPARAARAASTSS